MRRFVQTVILVLAATCILLLTAKAEASLATYSFLNYLHNVIQTRIYLPYQDRRGGLKNITGLTLRRYGASKWLEKYQLVFYAPYSYLAEHQAGSMLMVGGVVKS